jgi:hypothetical protein
MEVFIHDFLRMVSTTLHHSLTGTSLGDYFIITCWISTLTHAP